MFLSKLRRSRKLKLRWLKADDILPNPHQPRRQTDESALAGLTESVRRNGILQPLLVRPRDDGGFELLSGERRLLAARRASLPKVPCIILSAEPLLSALIPLCDSVHFSGLDVFEEATALRRMMDSFRLSRSHAATRLGISESAVSGRLSALRLNDVQRSRALEAGLSLSEIRAIASLSPESRDKAVGLCVGSGQGTDISEPRRKINGAADLRFFDNSLNRLVESLTSSGIKASCSRRNASGYCEYIIRVNRSDSSDRQLTLF